MKQIRKSARKIALVMSSALLFVSCSQYDDATTPNEKSNSGITQRIGDKYTGEQIIKGLFFFQNDISDNIAFLSEFKKSLKKQNNYYQSLDELNKMSVVSIDYIKKNNPAFLDEFQNAIYSNNYFEINKKMNEAVLLMTTALKVSTKYSDAIKFAEGIQNNPELKQFVTSIDLSTEEGKAKLNTYLEDHPELQYTGDKQNAAIPIFVAAAAVAYVAVAVVSMAAVMYSVYYKVAYWDKQNLTDLSETSITREVAIADISNYFQKN